MVNLTYSPTAVGSGTVTLDYGYTNDAGTSMTGTATVSYAATSNDNVVATTSPAGQIAAITGSTSAVGITFTTDDGQTATNLTITSGLTTLPAGWTGPTSLTCASVSTGTGCMLNLTYEPTADDSGSLSVGYSYTDNAGIGKTGTATISYAATSQDNVIATQSPAGQIAAVTGSTNAVGLTFTTDDGQNATNLSIMAGLSTLPAGWTGPASFACASVSTGGGCALNLTYKPTAVGSGTLTFTYSYTNNAGTSKTGTAMVSYAATSHDNVVATPSPSGQIAVVTGGTGGVGITFTTDDGAPATNLSITAGLSPLPSGWTGPATFTCATLSTGSGCLLNLTYAPTAFANGTLTLNYAYKNNAGTAKTGSVTVPYTATTNDNVIATNSPSGPIGAVVNSGSVPVTLTFTTDDGNPAANVTITSGLSTLPPGWSAPATFTCAAVSTGTDCQLTLTYAPSVNGSGTVSLGYSYNDDSGTAKTGTANIAYASIPGFLYLTDSVSNIVSCAVSGVDGSLSACGNVTTGLSAPTGIAFSGNFAYVTPGIASTDVDVCPVNANGTLGTCISAQTFSSPSALAVSGGYLYVTDGANVYNCPINANGSLGTCDASYIGTVALSDGIAVPGTTAYIVDFTGGNLTTCTVDSDGTLFPCTQQTLDGTAPGGGNTPNASPRSASVYGGNLYIGTNAGNMILPIAGDGTVTPIYSPNFCSLTPGTSCTIDGSASSPLQTPLTGFAFNNGYAYVAGYGNGGGIGICTIETSGVLDHCVSSPNPTLRGYGGIAVH